MKILIIGSTGDTGLEIIHQALDRRIQVTAVVRSPDKLSAFVDQIHVTTGNVFNSDVIAQAAAGADAVLSSIGAPGGFLSKGATTVYSRAAAALAAGMPQAGVNRLVFCTSAGVEPHDPAEALPYKLIAKPLFLQRAYDDMTIAETTIRSTQLRLTIVRPGRLTTNRTPGATPSAHDYAPPAEKASPAPTSPPSCSTRLPIPPGSTEPRPSPDHPSRYGLNHPGFSAR